MKIALVCPSNMLYMPYVENYIKILNEIGVDYDIINWDRFKTEEESEFIYRDYKIGHKRSFLDYLKYSLFVTNLLRNNDYDKVIVFGIQLVFFIKKLLIKEYLNKFIIDIRDYNRIIKYFKIKKVIDSSAFTVLSSHGYKQWLPKSNEYVINHNTTVKSLDELRKTKFSHVTGNKTSIGCIGALRDYKINIDFIEELKASDLIQLNYHGEGNINVDISKYLRDYNIKNVSLTGIYSREEEEGLYYKNNIINVLRYNDGINNKTALPNRLYNAVLYGKPLLAFRGTYLAKIIEQYNVGLVIDSFNNLENIIFDYLESIDLRKYNLGRSEFFDDVIYDNEHFKVKMLDFLT